MSTTATRIPAFLSVPTTAPSHKLLQVSVSKKQVIHTAKLQALCISVRHAKIPSRKLFASTSSSSPAVQKEEDEAKREEFSPSSDNDGALLQSESFTMDQDLGSSSSVRGCQACGKEEMERGCNGEGRIQGGIATVPGFGWWPIKAYRPCPSYLSTGGRYKRSGQSMDEIGFGGGGREASSSGNNGQNAQLRKRKIKKLGSSKSAGPRS